MNFLARHVLSVEVSSVQRRPAKNYYKLIRFLFNGKTSYIEATGRL
jgi:hypothetical protein